MLTATASWPTPKTNAIRFVLTGVAAGLVLFGVLRSSWMELHALLPFTQAEAALAFGLFGAPRLPIDVTLACSGADAIALCLGVIGAYPAALRRRVSGGAGAVAMIVALNVIRIGTLGQAARSPEWFNALHLFIWPAVLTLAMAAYVLIWMRAPDGAAVAVTPGVPAPPRLPARFIAFGAVFLLVFVAASPLYLNSAVVGSITAFIARRAAGILVASGVHAFASGSVLWAANGGFLVTGECVSTPLIPIYLAAVAAYVTRWPWRLAAAAAVVPIFVALGIVRLLVVALPGSLAEQTFFIHAFYQLLAGAAIVLGAAFWRHRDRTVFAWGVAGIGVGALFIAIAGPVYFRLLTSVVTFPAADPQGAMAFLPAFQTAVYFALWTAAFVNAGWARFAAGLAVLVAAQVLGLAAINFVLNHSGMTVAVRDVRGWALAAPVLVFAAMVTLGRAKR